MCSKSGLFYLKFMSSACQDSSTRGIFQKAKSNNNYEQVNEEKKKTEICKNFLFKGSCKYQENVQIIKISVHSPMETTNQEIEYLRMRTSKQSHARTIISLELAPMDQGVNTCTRKQRTRLNGGATYRNSLKRIWFHLLFHGKSKTRHHRSKEQTF
ncbi:hypothetical protein (macronuclear) [Paramecium tetraurelia strain d4-2]|uniref:C3H1-type domain-containing protein n=1 Tax=Paramecium tetraurelia TaxID=5888 RepID=Q6BFK5_PARTE|nr:hypothetical protein [Paramecium tetraurelia strain d4-2]CAH03565.1 hypothetical protein PTMB.368c [Paramecium tetraurelia]